MSTVAARLQPRRKHVSLVVPFFNEGEAVHVFHDGLMPVLALLTDYELEIVCVDDGSSDDTLARLLRLAAAHPAYRVIELSRNFGKEAALAAGLDAATGACVVPMDADLQDPPELLGEMMLLMDREEADVVYGQRRSRDGETWHKKATARLFYRLLGKLTDVPIPADTGDFRLMTRRALLVLQSMPEQHRFIRGMVSWIGFRQVPFRYDRERRFAG